VTDPQQVKLGAVQETLFIPLAARARETRKRRPILRDPKAVQMVESIDFDMAKYGRGAGGMVTTLRTAVFDVWVRNFLAANPDGTVIEIGTGLNARFERVDNGSVHWIDLDLPDTIELRRQYFAGTERRQMVAASVLDETWFQMVEERPPPYFFAAEGVLVYLAPDDVTRTLARIAERFPGALMALDTYSWQALRQNHRMAARHRIASWQWGCDDPRSLEELGLSIVETATITRPPALLRTQLPPAYRYLLPLADPILGRAVRTTLFRAQPLGGQVTVSSR
jgi:O-methyltransferase involved in polyketide biosynthesis